MIENKQKNEVYQAASLDPDRQDQAREYARIRRKFTLLDLALGVSLLLAWLLFGWSAQLRDWIFTWTQNPWLAVLVFGGIFGGVLTVLDLPLSYYNGFILPHRYGQSNQDLKGWMIDLTKNLLISGILGAGLLEVLYMVLRTAPDSWWIWIAGVLLFLNIMLSHLAPVLLFPVFNKFTPLEDDHHDLTERLMTLAVSSNTPVVGVYRFDMSKRTKSANAGLTGLGNTRRIILGDTLLEEFPPEEIETILAHELGHQKNNDMLLGIAVRSMITLGGLYLTSLGLNWGVRVFNFTSPSDIAALPLFVLLLGLFVLITSPLGNAFSRWREYLADDFALRITNQPLAYRSALIRLGNQNLAEVDPEPWVEFLLYSHPALNKRIQRAETYLQED